ncbi:MAG: hypothetical protein PF569_09860 [Candidatus Woesearchaeota archaeon]|jgi:hypothetical protein|nr:hypothetical protein [Candidatus Woesearchaeota archaeon]
MIDKIIIGILASILLIGTIIFFSTSDEIKEPFDCPSYLLQKDYPNYNVQMGFNKDNLYFATIDLECNLVEDNSKYLFNEYFTYQYAKIINNTPKSQIDDIHSSIKLLKKIIEEEFPETNNQDLNSLKDKIIYQIDNKIDPTNDINYINIVLDDYSNLYDITIYSIEDSLMSNDEINSFQNSYSLFVYDSLKYAGLLDSTEKTIVSNLGIWGNIVIWCDWFLWWTDWYQKVKKDYYLIAIENLFFDKPIDLLHKQMINNLE